MRININDKAITPEEGIHLRIGLPILEVDCWQDITFPIIKESNKYALDPKSFINHSQLTIHPMSPSRMLSYRSINSNK